MVVTSPDLSAFEAERAHLLALAYRMLGDFGRAEEIVQDAWLRWSGRQRDVEIDSPRAYLVTTVSRLCLTELGSARRQREDSRADRLPEPVDLGRAGLDRLERLEEVSMAFLVLLQRLTPAERAVLLLHDVFDFSHAEIAKLVDKSEAASRKILERARTNVAEEKRLLAVSHEAHTRMLGAFVAAATSADPDALLSLLADDAVLVTDGGPEGRRFEGGQNLPAPLVGARSVAAFLSTTAKRGARRFAFELRSLNGRDALVLREADGTPFAVVHVAGDGERIHRIWFHGDARRLGHVG